MTGSPVAFHEVHSLKVNVRIHLRGSGCEPGRQVEYAVRHLIIVGWSFHLEIDLAVNNVHDVATDPDVFALLAQMDAAGALEGGALGRDIGRLGESCADEPLCEAR